ncbi:MAG: TonB-dependent receptor [Pseudomonadota bacterium]
MSTAHSIKTLTCILAVFPLISQSNIVSGEPLNDVEHILVTADRREQASFEVPTSIEVFSRETIEKSIYNDPYEVIQQVPNAHISSQRPGTGESNFSIRGVGTTTVNVDQTIGFYVDDIPVASVSEFGLDLFDIERIEVLRGPQGTLYGRNALGGVVNIKTVRPQAENEARLTGLLGSDNEHRLSAMFNGVAFDDRLLARVNVQNADRDPRITNSAIGAEDVDKFQLNSFRGRFLILPTENVELLFSADALNSEKTTGLGQFDIAKTEGVNTIRPGIVDKDNHGLSLEARYWRNDINFISLTSARKHKQEGRGSRPETENFSPAIEFTLVFNNDYAADLDQTTLTQEFRAESDSDNALQWIAGIFLQRNDADRLSAISNVTTQLFEHSIANIVDTSTALFADASYQINEQLSVTTGVRFSRDKKRIDYEHIGSLAPLFGANFAPNLALEEEKTFNDISPRLVVEYKLTPEINLYSKISRAYKAGGFNSEFVGVGADSYDKENIVSYEAGVKTFLLQNRLAVEFNSFYMDWSDQQVLVFANGISQVANAERSVSKGAELFARLKPSDNTIISASVGYVDARLTDTPLSLNANDNVQPNTPDWSAALSAQFDYQLFNQLPAFLRADYAYQSEFFWDVGNTLRESDRHIVNLSTGLNWENVEFLLYAKNLTDEKYNLYGLPATPGFFAAQAEPAHGRELGVKVSLSF